MILHYVGESGGDSVGDGVRKLFKGVSFRVEADICMLTRAKSRGKSNAVSSPNWHYSRSKLIHRDI